jgi:uncharacterized membrane protein YvbJ
MKKILDNLDGKFDNIGEKLDNIGEKLQKTGKEAMNKTKDLAEIAKLSLAEKKAKKKILEAYAKIGREYVKLNLDNAERIMPEEFDVISAAEAEIKAIVARVRELKGMVLCPKCGAEMDEDVAFCEKCGAPNTVKDDIAAALNPVCPKCQAPVEAGQETCVICGAKL